MRLVSKHRGGISELLAAAWLLEQGYEVFRNVSAFGAVDLIAMKDGEVWLIDVKTARPNPDNIFTRTPEQEKLGVRGLCVTHSGEVFWAVHTKAPPLIASKPPRTTPPPILKTPEIKLIPTQNPMALLRRECRCRGIRLSRTDKAHELRAKLDAIDAVDA